MLLVVVEHVGAMLYQVGFSSSFHEQLFQIVVVGLTIQLYKVQKMAGNMLQKTFLTQMVYRVVVGDQTSILLEMVLITRVLL